MKWALRQILPAALATARREVIRHARGYCAATHMEPLDLRSRPPRSCYLELDGLLLMPRTIDKLRANLPGGQPGAYYINGPIPGISGYLLGRLGISEAELLDAIRTAADEDEVAQWLRSRVDATQYPVINQTLRRVKPKHTADIAVFTQIYSETMRAHPELEYVLDIVEADDRRLFPITG